MFHGSSTFRSKIALERGMNDVVVKDIVNDGGKSHGKASGRIRIAEHFAEEFKIGRRVWELNFGTIDGKKMVPMPETAGRKLAVEQIYRKVKKLLEKRGRDELPCFGKSLFRNGRKVKGRQVLADAGKVLKHGSLGRIQKVKNDLKEG